MGRVRVTSAFVTRWYEEWLHTGDTMVVDRHTQAGYGELQQRIERFLEAMGPEIARVLKHQLLEALLADTAKQQTAEVGKVTQ
jgi:hypothetical protein